MLLEALGHHWTAGARVKFLITPGGFVRSGWPHAWSGRMGWDSRPPDIGGLIAAAECVLRRVVTQRVLAAAAGKVDVLSIGIDLGTPPDPHVELVAVFDVRAGKLVRWTGKSYPTSDQERTFVQVADVKTHLLEIAGERVLILGCHDLNMFSPRAWAQQKPRGNRRKRCKEMRDRAKNFKPTLVLQHPHSTDTPNIWRMPWLSLSKEIPSVRAWASGIGYYRDGRPRAPLKRVLELTRGGEHCLDIRIHASDFA